MSVCWILDARQSRREGLCFETRVRVLISQAHEQKKISKIDVLLWHQNVSKCRDPSSKLADLCLDIVRPFTYTS